MQGRWGMPRWFLAWSGMLLAMPAWGQQGSATISIANRTSEVQSCRVRSGHSDWSTYHSIPAGFAITVPASDAQLHYIECQPPVKAGVYAAKPGDQYELTASGKGPAMLIRAGKRS